MKNISVKKVLKRTLGMFFSFVLVLVILSWFVDIENKELRGLNDNPSFICLNTTKPSNVYQEIKITDILAEEKLTTLSDSCSYESVVLEWTDEVEDEITFEVTVNDAGTYYIGLDYLSLNDTIIENSISVSVNGELQDDEASSMALETSWTNETTEKTFDKYNNQIANRQIIVPKWDYTVLRNQMRLTNRPVAFELNKGVNEITVEKLHGEFALGNIYLLDPVETPSYSEYLANTNGKTTSGYYMPIEAEHSIYKNDIAIRYEVSKTPNVTPYQSDKNFINIVGTYFNDPGQKITYGFEVEEDGYYNITFKYKNDYKENITMFRNIYVDGAILFDELAHYPFPYTADWTNMTLGSEEPFRFYFEKGVHTLSIEVDTTHIANSYLRINDIISEINSLALELNKITGGVDDKHREWNLDSYLPEAKTMLDEWINDLETILSDLKVMNSNPKQSNEITKKIETSLEKLKTLRKDYNQLPNRMNLLSEGSNSVSLTLAKVATELIDQPLSLDSLSIHSEDVKLPKPNRSIFASFMAGVQRLNVISRSEKEDREALEIWVNRSRFYIELMQQMADNEFTKETGIKVKFSVMPNEQKLIMANAAGTQPDVALGISGWLPYDLGIRGAAADLRQFDGFYELINNFEPGSLLHMIEDGKVYGLPETQDFYVTFYRKDIFEQLELEVPETYEEIIEILPTLQRYGMNYYLPLSASASLKAYSATSPFLFQYNAELYSANSFKTAIDTEQAVEAITMMTDLYTLYSLPLQTTNFYDDFRNGTLPIGVANFNTYIQLLFAAPELNGKWDIALSPGVLQEDGTIKRDNTATAQSAMIFEKSKKQEEAWQFLEWWLSTEVQSTFTYDLQLIYGDEFLWNSANVEAFKSLPIEQEDIQVILDQWEYIHEVPKTPGSYIIERELSNIWNKVVFDSESVRVAIDDAIVTINRELARKYEEFKYLDSRGNVIKDYELPTIEMVREWQRRGQLAGESK